MTKPKKLIDPEHYPRITAWAAQGLSIAQIGQKLGMSETAFSNRLKDTEEVYHAFKVGRAEEETRLVNTLATQAADPNHPKSTTAAIFLLKSRHQYSDQPAPTPPIQITQNTLQLKFPKALPLEKLSALATQLAPGSVIEGERATPVEAKPANKGRPEFKLAKGARPT